MTVNKYINEMWAMGAKQESSSNLIQSMSKADDWPAIIITSNANIYNCKHESRDTIKQWSFEKVDMKAMQFPLPNVNIDIWHPL